MIWFLVLLLFLLVGAELRFYLRSKKWVSAKVHPSLFFLMGLFLLTICFSLSYKGRPFSLYSHALVFSVDPRMTPKQILEAKEIIKKSISVVSCPFGLTDGSGRWLCPLSEDRVFFLLQLDAITSNASFSQEPFPFNTKEISSEKEFIFFTEIPRKIESSFSSMTCIPTKEFGTWKIEEGSFKKLLTSEGVLERIRDKEYAETLEIRERVKPYEKERLAFFLLLTFILIYRFRKEVPLLSLLCCLSSSLWSFDKESVTLSEQHPISFDENQLAAALSSSGEVAQAKRYLKLRYATEVSDFKRASFAFNLALLSARSEDFKEALFWLKKVDPNYASSKEIHSFAQDLLSSLIFEGNTTPELRRELQELAKDGIKTPWREAALVYSPAETSIPFFYGLSTLSERATSPELLRMNEDWKHNILQLIGERKEDILFHFEKQSLFLMREEFEKAFQKGDIERLSILLELIAPPTIIEKLERLIALGMRESRLFSFFHMWSEDREKTASWIMDLILYLSDHSLYDIRLRGKDGTSLFRSAWKMGGSFQKRWERMNYYEVIIRKDEESPWKQAVLCLDLLSNNEERYGALRLLLEWLGYQGVYDNSLNSFIDAWIARDPSDVVDSLYDSSTLQELTKTLEYCGGEKTLFPFFQKAIDLTLSSNEMKNSPLMLVHTSWSIIEAMRGQIFHVKTVETFLNEAIDLTKKAYETLFPLLLTNQEKRIASHLLTLIQEFELKGSILPSEGSDLLLHIGKTFALLEYVLEQEDAHVIPRKMPNEKTVLVQKGSAGIDEDKAVQLVLELEREERAVDEGKR